MEEPPRISFLPYIPHLAFPGRVLTVGREHGFVSAELSEGEPLPFFPSFPCYGRLPESWVHGAQSGGAGFEGPCFAYDARGFSHCCRAISPPPALRGGSGCDELLAWAAVEEGRTRWKRKSPLGPMGRLDVSQSAYPPFASSGHTREYRSAPPLTRRRF